MGAQGVSSFSNEKVGFIHQCLPSKKHVLTALKIVALLAALCLIAKVGIPFIIQGNALRLSVPLWGTLTVAQRELWKQGARLSLVGYFVITAGITAAISTGRSLYLDFSAKKISA